MSPTLEGELLWMGPNHPPLILKLGHFTAKCTIDGS